MALNRHAFMSGGKQEPVLRGFTPARISLGAVGACIPCAEHLRFKLAHACARDAVFATLDQSALAAWAVREGWPVIHAESLALNRDQYLQRPDLGRRLGQLSGTFEPSPHLVVVLADGLSAGAVTRNAPGLLDRLLPQLRREGYRIGPMVIAEQARVALGDEIAEYMDARMVLVLIGERPGLSSPESLGAYLTYAPLAGTKDARRNCVSNIHPGGLSVETAASRIFYLLTEAFRRGLSGVALKDDTGINGSAALP